MSPLTRRPPHVSHLRAFLTATQPSPQVYSFQNVPAVHSDTGQVPGSALRPGVTQRMRRQPEVCFPFPQSHHHKHDSLKSAWPLTTLGCCALFLDRSKVTGLPNLVASVPGYVCWEFLGSHSRPIRSRSHVVSLTMSSRLRRRGPRTPIRGLDAQHLL
jgi:hypothetical protein